MFNRKPRRKDAAMDDRRIFERIDAEFPLRFLNPTSGKEGRAQTVDISADGLGVVAEERIFTGTPLELWLDIPDQHEPLYTRGEVVWSKPWGTENQQRLGVHLERAELMGLARALWIRKRKNN